MAEATPETTPVDTAHVADVMTQRAKSAAAALDRLARGLVAATQHGPGVIEATAADIRSIMRALVQPVPAPEVDTPAAPAK